MRLTTALFLALALLAQGCARAPVAPAAVSGANAFAQQGPSAAAATAAQPGVEDPKRLRLAMLAPIGKAGASASASASAGSGAGDENALGLMLERAARLAMRDAGAPFELDVIDTGTGVGGVVDATQSAIDAGARMVVGPIYAADVAAAANLTLRAGVPMLAFTSDTSQARGGVYANAFTPQSDIRATLRHAVRLGSRHVVVFAPKGRYGDIVLRTAKKTLDRVNGQIAFVVRTDGTPQGYRAAALQAAVAVEGADTIYMPEGGKAPRAILGELAKAGTRLSGKRLLGSGQWVTADLADARLDGALFAANDERAFKSFAYRYEATHATKPTPIAALAYDAVAVAVALVRRSPGNPWTRAAIESSPGFNGATGLFRFRADGTVERALAIREVRDGKTQQVKASGKTFDDGPAFSYRLPQDEALASLRR